MSVCSWCGATLPAAVVGLFCDETCRSKWTLRDHENRRAMPETKAECGDCRCGNPKCNGRKTTALRALRRHDGPPVRRRGDWIQVYSGIQFWPIDPRPEEILVSDMAHSLAQQCRFTGHTREFYSIAQHCCLVHDLIASWLTDPVCDVCGDPSREVTSYREQLHEDHALGRCTLLCATCEVATCGKGVWWTLAEARWLLPRKGLGHDGSEAYLCDIARPVKHLPAMQPYRNAEAEIQDLVYVALGVGGPEPYLVKRADDILLATEARDLMAPLHPQWTVKPPAYPVLPDRIEPWGPKRAEREWLRRYRDSVLLQNGMTREPAPALLAAGSFHVNWPSGETEEDVLARVRDLYRAAQVPGGGKP